MQKEGFTKIFAIEDMRRLPISMDEETRRAIAQTTYEGRQFPQALADVFGMRVLSATDILLALHPMAHFFPDHSENAAQLLKITIRHRLCPIRDHTFLVQLNDLKQMHPSGFSQFKAHDTALELYRLYIAEQGGA